MVVANACKLYHHLGGIEQSLPLEYYSVAKILEYNKALSGFTHDAEEMVIEAWDRFKELLRLCPQYGLTEPLLLQQFYGGMIEIGKQVLDRFNPQGYFNGLNETNARNTSERLYKNSRNWRTRIRKKPQKQPINVTNSSFDE